MSFCLTFFEIPHKRGEEDDEYGSKCFIHRSLFFLIVSLGLLEVQPGTGVSESHKGSGNQSDDLTPGFRRRDNIGSHKGTNKGGSGTEPKLSGLISRLRHGVLLKCF
tara:strand:+ start:1977 stop:2297 length:321 start_codon:yes stop_codon:yes gene_type:complete